MNEYRELINSLKIAENECVASLIREGLSRDEAIDEAYDYIKIPQTRHLHSDITKKFVEITGYPLIPEDFLSISQELDLSGVKIWDLSLVKSENEQVTDLFYDGVLEYTKCFYDEFNISECGLIIGTVREDWLFLEIDPPDVYSLCLMSHENAKTICRASRNLSDFLTINAQLSKEYFSRIESGKTSFYWQDEILSEVSTELSTKEWLSFTLSQRPRPF